LPRKFDEALSLLQPDYGSPFRLIVPGWFAVAAVK
jgi:DMSO/TMAO reductase YedYZ molybdopterin-dependent catalytic subunit